MESEIIKQRSLSSCIKESYTLFTTNLKKVFLRTWIWILVSAVGISATIFEVTALEFSAKPGSSFSLTAVFVFIGIIIAVFGAIETYTRFFSLLNGLNYNHNRRRVGTAFITAILISLTATIIFYIGGLLIFVNKTSIAKGDISSFYKAMGFFVLCMLVFCLVILPIIYVFMKYIMEPEDKLWRKFGSNLKVGMCHWGFIFSTLFVSGLIIGLIELVVSIPSIILSNVQISSAIGVSEGDASGLPTYFNVLIIITLIISMLICSFVSLWQTVVVYYLYGSIEAQNREREKRKLADKQGEKEL